MRFNWDDPNTWGGFKPQIIAHDVGRSRDRSTAVFGGNCPFEPSLVGISELIELPHGFGHARAAALAEIDRRYDSNSLIVADLTFDPTYVETLFETFGRRVIGLHIGPYGNGQECVGRQVKGGWIPVYNIGRSYLLEHFHTVLQSGSVRFVDGPASQRAYAQLMALETEIKETGISYNCPAGQHDDLGMSCAMLVWAAGHQHMPSWFKTMVQSRMIRKPRPAVSWRAWT